MQYSAPGKVHYVGNKEIYMYKVSIMPLLQYYLIIS